MRKIIVLAVLLLVVLTFFALRREHAAIDPAAFLPADTLAYVDERDAARRGERFLASPLGQTVANLDMPGLMRDLDAPPDAQAAMQGMINDFKSFIDSHITAELLSDHFVLAALPHRDWMGEAGALPGVRRQLLLLCKPRHGATAIDLLASIYSGDLKTEVVPYGKYNLKRFVNAHISFAACAVEGWLLVAFEERALREALDTFDAGARSLAADAGFKNIVANLPESEQLLFLRLDGLRALANASLHHLPATDTTAITKQIDSAAGFGDFAYGSRLRGHVFQERMVISFDPDSVSPAARHILNAPATVDALLPHLRDNLLFYFYSGATDWSAFDETLAKNQAVVEGFSGLKAEELKRLLGDGASRLFIRQGEGGQTLPLPLVNFCLTPPAPDQLGETVSTLLAKTGIEMTKGKFHDAAYQVWNKAPEKNLRLYSATWRGQWCLGNSLDFFKEIVQPADEATSLIAAEGFKIVADGINRPAQSLMYIRWDQAVGLLRDAAGWFATIVAVKDRDLSAKTKLINERLVFPLLEATKMYQRSLSHGLVEGNLLKIDAQTSIAPPEVK
ncbi:MAG: DUF3352 domain-containing protein [Desulfobulbaceae bacterium]|jgi:hypothetical protein|nr:DUF3352 domain-containing protein [Desulfobulbaceae bacterium]